MFTLTISSDLVHLPTFFLCWFNVQTVNTSNMSDCQCYQKTNHSPSQWRAMTIYAVAWARNPRSIQLISLHPTSNQSQSCLSTLILLPSPQPRPSWAPHLSPLSLLTSNLAGAAKVIIAIPCWYPINNFQIGFRRKSKLLLKTFMTWSLSTC